MKRITILLAALGALVGCATPDVDQYPYGKAIQMPGDTRVCSAKSGNKIIAWSCRSNEEPKVAPGWRHRMGA